MGRVSGLWALGPLSAVGVAREGGGGLSREKYSPITTAYFGVSGVSGFRFRDSQVRAACLMMSSTS